MTDVQADRAAYHRERDLDWVASRYIGGDEIVAALRGNDFTKRQHAINGLINLAYSMSRLSHARSWAYCHPTHMGLCRIIERERALLAAEALQAARRKHQTAVREVRHLLHRRGWAPKSLLRRLGTARGGFLAAIAGRCSREDLR